MLLNVRLLPLGHLVNTDNFHNHVRILCNKLFKASGYIHSRHISLMTWDLWKQSSKQLHRDSVA
jgi:hypothetical protein